MDMDTEQDQIEERWVSLCNSEFEVHIFQTFSPCKWQKPFKPTRVKWECINLHKEEKERWLGLGPLSNAPCLPCGWCHFLSAWQEPWTNLVKRWSSWFYRTLWDYICASHCFDLRKPLYNPLLKVTLPSDKATSRDKPLAGLSAKSGTCLYHRGLVEYSEKLKIQSFSTDYIAIPNYLQVWCHPHIV